MIRALTCAGVRSGAAPRISATRPATCGAAYEVPELSAPTQAEVATRSGPTTSGLRSPMWFGPQALYGWSSSVSQLTAPTVITSAMLPGTPMLAAGLANSSELVAHVRAS